MVAIPQTPHMQDYVDSHDPPKRILLPLLLAFTNFKNFASHERCKGFMAQQYMYHLYNCIVLCDSFFCLGAEVMNCETKHALHCAAMLGWILGFAYFCGVFTEPHSTVTQSPFESYGYTWTTFLYLLRFTALLVLPQCLCNLLGLVLFNAFREKVPLKAAPLLSPFVCFRVVTKGHFPLLVKENIATNMKTCYDAGIENFIFEVVTDKAIHLPPQPRVREVVVPTTYRQSFGDNDWIVHLDEETLLTTNAICGILNFCEDGRHQFGQGVITYASGEIVNWLTTLSDSFRVADDMGKLRLQFKLFHKPLFGWKGSFVVTQVGFYLEIDLIFD
ncbi:hypothetical protein GCK32_012727 [Trichostrongylus colubriformis]|uniref:Glycosyltransferase 2-like domain-containing protein n=1 Tax=Trichostrongylus colubriformis TaxID=6319 RepID=A0AAN8FP01_TRICO